MCGCTCLCFSRSEQLFDAIDESEDTPPRADEAKPDYDEDVKQLISGTNLLLVKKPSLCSHFVLLSSC